MDQNNSLSSPGSIIPTTPASKIKSTPSKLRWISNGLNIFVPVIDRIKYVQSLKEIAIEIPQQGAITLDNVQVQLDGVLYLRVTDPYKASYGVDDPEFAVTQLAQTTMRSEVGKISLELAGSRARFNAKKTALMVCYLEILYTTPTSYQPVVEETIKQGFPALTLKTT